MAITKLSLVKEMALVGDTTQAAAARMYNDMITTIKTELMMTGRALLPDLGVFKVRERKATTRRNPQNGDPVPVPAHKTVVFRPGPDLKDAVK